MKILVYPQDNNPYQRLLYQELAKKFTIRYLVGPTKSHSVNLLLLPLMLFKYKLSGFGIFHIHWLYPFQFPFKQAFFHSFFFRLLYTAYFLSILVILKILGYRIVWTMHDLTSHEKIFLNDLYISKIIFFMSSAQILNSDATLERIKKLHFITKNSYIVPHGNYVNFYTNTVSQIVSRRLLHIPKDEFVYLFFGRIEKYKGVDLLINLFNKANIKGTRLLIAGNASDPSIKKSLQSINEKSIDIHIGFVPDDKVQVYMNAANVVVLPFRKITTSGSALLALSFGKPIICPQLGDLVEFPDDFTFFYNPQNSKNLLNTLVSVYKDRKNLGSKGRQALKYAQSISWQEAATKTQLVYNSLD